MYIIQTTSLITMILIHKRVVLSYKCLVDSYFLLLGQNNVYVEEQIETLNNQLTPKPHVL